MSYEPQDVATFGYLTNDPHVQARLGYAKLPVFVQKIFDFAVCIQRTVRFTVVR